MTIEIKSTNEYFDLPLKIGGDNPPNTASFIDDNPDNPVQICDASGNMLMIMSLDAYREIMQYNKLK